MLYRHYLVPCLGCQVGWHGMPLPRPSQVGIDGNLPEITMAKIRVVLACPDCGRVSEYYERDIRETPVHIPDGI